MSTATKSKAPARRKQTDIEKRSKAKFFAKAVPFRNMYVPVKVDKRTGMYMYGKDNRLPNKLMQWVLDSGTAKKAQAKRATYIAADGFTNPDSAKFQVNPKQTADKALNEISGYQSFFKGFALHIKRDLNKKVISAKCLPFQDVRKLEDGRFCYNPTWSTGKYNKDKDQIIQPFKNDLTDKELLDRKEHGELLYAYNESADNPHYPIPDYYAGIEDIRSSAEIQKFDLETVLNAFITSAILTLIGEIDDETEDESGKTEWDYYLEQLEAFTGEVKDDDGLSGRMRMLILKARTKDEVPDLKPFDAKVIIDASNSKRDLIDRAVSRLFAVHPVLLGFADAQVLGNTQAIANASQELNNDVIPDQRLITETFKLLWPDKDWTVSSFRPIQYVPDSLLGELTPEEKRALIGYPKLENTSDGNNKLLSERLGVGGTQSLVSILADPNLKPEQKRNALKILFGLSEADATALVPVETPAA